uniref:Uncharacterized protein n=1 Tax=Candidatus Kentrum sp. MB TaxID=2138164 RepID=A0A450XGG2_9GAMM|nr:MAG: hypothetical protein BECKMB1821I_GA0114274_100622 [Candidatus Kentron sp. MB]VFK74219.1 MAG: hypothetical protein BECKMB1821H_GA0114242_100240 [Candidatus Kentron sp. MB]
MFCHFRLKCEDVYQKTYALWSERWSGKAGNRKRDKPRSGCNRLVSATMIFKNTNDHIVDSNTPGNERAFNRYD